MIQIRTGMPSASYQQHLKDQNATLLFDLVRRRAPISRAELTKASGLSAATVTVLVDELLQGGWLVELGAVGSTARGRRPINLAVNAARGAVATLEILSDGSILSVYDICLHKLTQTRSRLPASTSAPIIAQLRAQLAALGLAEEQLLGIHILYPGLIDAMTERLSFSAVIRSWQQCCPTILPDSRAAFPDAYVMLSNNAAAVAYSAFLRDTEPPPLPLLVMTVQEGIDAGTVLPGGRSMPLEAGHISIDRNGPACNCGNRGCLETLCSTTALFARLRAAGIPVSYQDIYGSDPNEAAIAELAVAFTSGDEAVTACLQRYGMDLCCAIVSLVNLLDVRAVRLGGFPYLLGEPFAELLRSILAEKFHILTSTGELELQLFDCKYEDVRKAAVLQTLEAIFSKHLRGKRRKEKR